MLAAAGAPVPPVSIGSLPRAPRVLSEEELTRQRAAAALKAEVAEKAPRRLEFARRHAAVLRDFGAPAGIVGDAAADGAPAVTPAADAKAAAASGLQRRAEACRSFVRAYVFARHSSSHATKPRVTSR